MNVLRRLLGRYDVKPSDVAALGLSKIESAQGMGTKGLTNVLSWLAEHGHYLGDINQKTSARRQQRLDRRLQQAQHLLEQWGWQVERPEHLGPLARELNE